jgi:hypothetical protein
MNGRWQGLQAARHHVVFQHLHDDMPSDSSPTNDLLMTAALVTSDDTLRLQQQPGTASRQSRSQCARLSLIKSVF